MSKADRAEELFRQGYNCSQSVFAAFAEEAGMTTSRNVQIGGHSADAHKSDYKKGGKNG